MTKKQWTGRVYLGQTADGKQRIKWVGRFDTKRERDRAVAEARRELEQGHAALPTCDAYVDHYLADYARRWKHSAYTTQRQRLSRFKKDFAGVSLDVSRKEAREWAAGEGRWKTAPKLSAVAAVVSLYNFAIHEDDLPLERNPFRKLTARQKRSDARPPTDEEFTSLVEGCSALGTYAPMMRGLFLFAAYSLMRPSECFELEWADIDFERMRIRKARRLYRGTVDEPKTGPKTIALTPPARDAIIGLPRDGRLVFRSKTDKRLSESRLTEYWSTVCARADLRFTFYMATKHYGVHYMWTELRMSRRAIAAQAGWSPRTVDKMLEVYGHGDIGALEEVDAAFGENVRELKVVGGEQS